MNKLDLQYNHKTSTWELPGRGQRLREAFGKKARTFGVIAGPVIVRVGLMALLARVGRGNRHRRTA